MNDLLLNEPIWPLLSTVRRKLVHFAGHKENFANPSLVHFSFCLILEAFLISLNFLTLINAIRILILVFDITFSVFPSRVFPSFSVVFMALLDIIPARCNIIIFKIWPDTIFHTWQKFKFSISNKLEWKINWETDLRVGLHISRSVHNCYLNIVDLSF